MKQTKVLLAILIGSVGFGVAGFYFFGTKFKNENPVALIAEQNKVNNPKEDSNIDCGKDENKMQEICQAKLPCDQQDEMFLTEECIRTYKCPSPPAVSADLTLVAIVHKGTVIGTVALTKEGKFQETDPNAYAAEKYIYFKERKEPFQVSSRASYDGVESDRCYFDITFLPHAPTDILVIGTNKENSNVNSDIHSPSADESALFEKTHKFCKKESCTSEEEWGLNMLFAVTDLNGDGNKEYWYTFAEGYRIWANAEEYSESTQKWVMIFTF